MKSSFAYSLIQQNVLTERDVYALKSKSSLKGIDHLVRGKLVKNISLLVPLMVI